jgi:hypothetical protein
MKMLNGSWKTTLLGASGLLVIIGNLMNVYLDDDPKTAPDWSIYLPLIVGGIANMLSKDINVSNAPKPTEEGHKVKMS